LKIKLNTLKRFIYYLYNFQQSSKQGNTSIQHNS